jgi:hypothetical protein
MIRTVAVICWPYHLHGWPPFVSLQYFGNAFLMRGITELQDLLAVIADWHLACRGQFQHTVCALHVHVWTMWIWCRAFAINNSYHTACQKIETVINVIKTSYQTNCLVCYMRGRYIETSVHLFWRDCRGVKKIVQDYHNCDRALIVSDAWDNNKGKWKSCTFHIGLKIVAYLNMSL